MILTSQYGNLIRHYWRADGRCVVGTPLIDRVSVADCCYGEALSTGLLDTAAADEKEYRTVVDIVEVGADDTGGEVIDDGFEEHASDDTLIGFPEGRYLVSHPGPYPLMDFTMVGDNDITLVPGPNYDEDLWIVGTETRNLRFENFTIDATGEGAIPGSS